MTGLGGLQYARLSVQSLQYITALLQKSGKWGAIHFSRENICTLGIESTQRGETMNRIVKQKTHPTFPLEKLLERILEIEEQERESALRLQNLYNAGSHLVASRKGASLSQKLSAVGFGALSRILAIIAQYSRWSLCYTLEQVSKSLGFVVKGCDVQTLQNGPKAGFNLCKVSVCRAEDSESITKVGFLFTAEKEIEGIGCECLGPQQVRLACRHIYAAYGYLCCACLRLGEETLVVKSDRAALFRLVADERWKWTGEPAIEDVQVRNMSKEVRVLHRSLPIDDLHPNAQLANARSEEASTYRFNQLMILEKHIATFASPLPDVYRRVRFNLEEILKARMQLERIGRQAGRDQRTLNRILSDSQSPQSKAAVERENSSQRDQSRKAQRRDLPRNVHRENDSVTNASPLPLQGAEKLPIATQKSVNIQKVQQSGNPSARPLPAADPRARRNENGEKRREDLASAADLRASSGTGTQNQQSEDTGEVLTPLLPQERDAVLPQNSPQDVPRNPPHRRGKGPLRNIHKLKGKSKTREFGASLRARNIQNQDLCASFKTDERKALMRKFFTFLELTRYGPDEKFVFQTSDEKWPCLVKLLGGNCPSARGARLRAAFRGLKGVQRHMRTAHNMELLEYAAKIVEKNAAFFEVDEEDEWASQDVENDGLEEEQSSIACTSADEARKRRKRKRQREHEQKKRKRMLADKDISSSERDARYNLGFYSSSSENSRKTAESSVPQH